MKKIKVVGVGYRSWAKSIFNAVGEFPHVDLVQVHTKDTDLLAVLKVVEPDVVLFYGWSWIVPDAIISQFSCYCLHPSDLPNYRGGSPIQHQVLNGKLSTQLTLFKMDHDLDTGPIWGNWHLSLYGNIEAIYSTLQVKGLVMTKRFLEAVDKGDVVLQEQRASTTPSFNRRRPEQSEITLQDITDMTAEQFHNKVRCLTDPYPNAFITCGDGTRIYITETKLRLDSYE